MDFRPRPWRDFGCGSGIVGGDGKRMAFAILLLCAFSGSIIFMQEVNVFSNY